MNVKYGIPIVFIPCGIVLLFFNILNSSSNYERSNKRRYSKISDSNYLLDLVDFKYDISRKCVTDIKIIWIVTSYAGDVSKRSALRQAYNSQELFNLGIQRIFILGKLDKIAEKITGISQSAIDNEAQRFNDILQGNFVEAYRNLTYKHTMGLRWIVENCHNISYIMKMDDDIVINLYDILDKLENIRIDNSIVGYVMKNMRPIREPANKWFITRNEYAPDFYPQFVSGWFYITTKSVIFKLIIELESHQEYFWIDDVFVTGILREEANINLIDIHEIYTTDPGFLKCCIESGKKGFKCEFAIGPNGGDVELQIQFQKFAYSCRNNCRSKSISKSCVIGYKRDFGKGHPLISPINIS